MQGLLMDPQTEDLLVENGRVEIGDISHQTAEFILVAARGEFKELPLVGGEVRKLQGGTPDPMWCNNVKRMLQACGLSVTKVSMTNEGIITLE